MPRLLGLLATAVLLLAAPAAQGASDLTFAAGTNDYYQLDSDGNVDNTITLDVADDGDIIFTDSDGITDSTSPADRCATVSATRQKCTADDPDDDVPSVHLTPAGGDNTLNFLRVWEILNPAPAGLRIDFVEFSGGDGCDNINADAVIGPVGMLISMGAAPAACTQDVETPTSGTHTITLVPSAGRNKVTGGSGKDVLDFSAYPEGLQISEDGQANDGEKSDADDNYHASVDEYLLTPHNDNFSGSGKVEGGNGNDVLDAAGTSGDFEGGEGNDILTGGPLHDVLHGGNGNNTITALAGDDEISGGTGVDNIDAGPGNDGSIPIGLGNDIVSGGDGSETINDLGGDDQIDVGAGNDVVNAGAGVDTVTGGSGDDNLNGQGENDTINAGEGNDTVDGGTGDDALDGGPGDDGLTGGDGNDPSITGGDGRDTIAGGPGNEPVLSGGGNDDSITGGTGDDGLDGGVGDDALFPGDGTDTNVAGPGDDTIADSKGADVINGGEGTIDAIAYGAYAPDGPLSLTLDGAANDGRAGEGDNLLEMESLTGGPQADTITGDGAVNYLNGGDGDDTIDGLGAIDVLRGQYGNDVVIGRDAQLVRDDIGCNEGPADTAVADANDIVAYDCEAVDRSAAPPGVNPANLSPSGLGPGTAGEAQTASGGPGDRTGPVVKLSGVPGRIAKSDLRAKGITVSVGVNEPASLEVRLVGRATRAQISAARDIVLVERKAGLAGGTRKVKLKPTAALLGRASKFKLRVVVLATDAAGNRTTVTRSFNVAPKKRKR